MIKSQFLRTIMLCSLTIVIALFLHPPFVVFPNSFLATDHVRNPENVTLSTSALLFGSINTFSQYYQVPHQARRLHRRVANDDGYLKPAKKGWALRCLMDASIEEAPRMVQNSPKWKTFSMESLFIDPLMAPLEWGWKIETLTFENAPNIISDYKCAKMLDFLHVATDLKFWTQQLVSHQHEWHSEDGRSGPVSELLPSYTQRTDNMVGD